MEQATGDIPELMVKVQSRDPAGGEVWTVSVGPRFLALLDRFAEHCDLVGKENEDPLRGRLCALGQLLAAHGTIKAVYPLM
jgi:hypothetical protein